MLDPSLLVQESTLRWLEEHSESLDRFVISEHLSKMLRTRKRYRYTPLSRVPNERLARLARITEHIGTFSAEDDASRIMSTSAASVLLVLQERATPSSAIYADEFAFLYSRSWLASKSRTAIDHFREAGAAILERGQDVLLRVVRQVVPEDHIPSIMTEDFLDAVAVKWVVVGKAVELGTLNGGPWGGIVGAAAAPILQAFDP